MPDRFGQQHLGIFEAFLTLTQNTQATQDIGIIWMRFQVGRQITFSHGQVVLLQGFQTTVQQRITAPGNCTTTRTGLGAPFDQQGTDFFIVRVGAQKLLEEWLLRGLGWAHPCQCQAPAFIRIPANVLALSQLGQGTNALLARTLITRQVFG